MPSANAPANITPIAASSRRRPDWLMAPMPSDTNTAATNAPAKMLVPARKAITTPGKTACAKASPTNAMPRSTTKQPITPQTTPTIRMARKACCMKTRCQGSVSQSMARSSTRAAGGHMQRRDVAVADRDG